jgi:aminoglycoside phosphotransferase (APT) family kinase protein
VFGLCPRPAALDKRARISSVDAILEFLNRAGLVAPGETPRFESLSGGVSSDIWIVHTAGRSFCLKRALPQLRVAAEWLAPIERNATEVCWLRAASSVMPGIAPRVLADDARLAVFAMEYLSPSLYEPWKARLGRGAVDATVGTLVGERLAALHRAFANSETASREFATDATFYALRLEPYLVATSRAHPDLTAPFEKILSDTARTRLSVVHGDVSPKNILLGPAGPVFIDAECAWYGDPAFDLAFCLNHLLLKALWVPSAGTELRQTFAALRRAYLEGVDWERPQSIEGRAAHLLPALLLARIDGKSPVEYLNDDISKATVRRVARNLLLNPPDRLDAVSDAFQN